MTETPQTIESAAAALRNHQITSEELTGALLERIEHLNPQLGAFIAISANTAIADAKVADAELARGVDRGPLHGIPIGVKDIIATREMPTTANSHILDPKWGE